MSFIWPMLLFLLIIIPILVLWYFSLQRRRSQLSSRYGELGFTGTGPSRKLGGRRHLPAILFLLSLVILVIAMARPQTVLSLPRDAGTVILAFDVSGSMAADDLKPTRMEAAKVAARDFVQHRPLRVQIGIIAFSDSGLSVQNPTDDQQALLASINRLTPQRGTSLANGILAALNSIAGLDPVDPGPNLYSTLTPDPTPSPTPMPPGTYSPAVIVLLTDGENNESPDPLAAAQMAAERGVRIYTVGIGSATGAVLHINGFSVFTALDETGLQEISKMTGGIYYNAQSAQNLRSIYDHLNSQLVITPQKTEVTSIFAGAGIFFLLSGGMLSLVWFGRVP